MWELTHIFGLPFWYLHIYCYYHLFINHLLTTISRRFTRKIIKNSFRVCVSRRRKIRSRGRLSSFDILHAFPGTNLNLRDEYNSLESSSMQVLLNCALAQYSRTNEGKFSMKLPQLRRNTRFVHKLQWTQVCVMTTHVQGFVWKSWLLVWKSWLLVD